MEDKAFPIIEIRSRGPVDIVLNADGTHTEVPVVFPDGATLCPTEGQLAEFQAAFNKLAAQERGR